MNEFLQKIGAVLFSGDQIDRDTALALTGAEETLVILKEAGLCEDSCREALYARGVDNVLRGLIDRQ